MASWDRRGRMTRRWRCAALWRTSGVDGSAFGLPLRGRPICETEMIPRARASVDDVVEFDLAETGVDGQSKERLVETRGRRAEDGAVNAMRLEETPEAQSLGFDAGFEGDDFASHWRWRSRARVGGFGGEPHFRAGAGDDEPAEAITSSAEASPATSCEAHAELKTAGPAE